MNKFVFVALLETAIMGAAIAPVAAGGYTATVVEAPVAAPASVQAFSDWAGAYAGISLGYGFAGDDRVGLHNGSNWLGHLGTLDEAGLYGDARLGYRWQRGSWVFGPELGVGFGDIKDDFRNGGYSAETKLKQFYALRFKTGYIVNDSTLVFGSVGVARAKFDYSVQGSGNPAIGAVDIDQDFNRTGYLAGFGIERKLSDHLSLTGEYEYATYGKKRLQDPATGSRTEATPKYHNVKVGLNYRF